MTVPFDDSITFHSPAPPEQDEDTMDTVSGAEPDAPSQRAPLRDEVRQTVLERIVSGELPPESRINESRLAAELGVSRTPLREALFLLESDGFVRADLARGFSVSPLSTRELREVYPIVETLECLALRTLGPIAGLSLDELREINRSFAAAAGDSKRCIELDAAWHVCLLNRCPNQRLLSLISTLKQTILRYEHLYMMDAQLVAMSVTQHDAIANALEGGNMDDAIKALETNWRFSLDTLLLRIGEPSTAAYR